MCFKWFRKLSASNGDEIYCLLQDIFSDASIYMSDDRYDYVNKNKLLTFLAGDKTNLATYIPEDYDCDDFSFRLMGQFHLQGSGFEDKAIGIIWLQQPAHALNVCVTKERKVLLIEPQTDKVYVRPEDYIGQLVVM